MESYIIILIIIALILYKRKEKKKVDANNSAYNYVGSVNTEDDYNYSVYDNNASDTIATQDSMPQRVDLPEGTTLQDYRYQVVSYLASGGFGNTYVVKHTKLGSLWVMKEFYMRGINTRIGTTVSVSLPENEDVYLQMKKKFLKEAQRMSALKNEHIVEVIDFFEENGTAYYIMKYIEGMSLAARMRKQQRPLSEQLVRGILRQVLDALQCMHSNHIYHLDLKPGNIMCDNEGHVYLIDFGSSKQLSLIDYKTQLTSTGLSYTPGYAPSEQISGNSKRIGPWTDFYALGATLYNLLTNSLPPEENDIIYDGEKAFNFRNTSQEMRNLILRLMTPRYDQRPQNVDEIEQLIQNMEQWPYQYDEETDKEICNINDSNDVVTKITSDNDKDQNLKRLKELRDSGILTQEEHDLMAIEQLYEAGILTKEEMDSEKAKFLGVATPKDDSSTKETAPVKTQVSTTDSTTNKNKYKILFGFGIFIIADIILLLLLLC